MTPEIYAIKQTAIVVAFIVCMYFGFSYDSAEALLGALIAFFSIGNTPPAPR